MLDLAGQMDFGLHFA